jgi:hypothetical protein
MPEDHEFLEFIEGTNPEYSFHIRRDVIVAYGRGKEGENKRRVYTPTVVFEVSDTLKDIKAMFKGTSKSVTTKTKKRG